MRFLQKQKKAIIQIFQIVTSYLFTAINHARNSPLSRAYSTSSSSRASSWALGDGGMMKNRNGRVALLEVLNFCNEVGDEAPSMRSPRLVYKYFLDFLDSFGLTIRCVWFSFVSLATRVSKLQKWSVHGYPDSQGDVWIGDSRTWDLDDVGSLSSSLYFYQDPGTRPAKRVWTSINVGTEIYVSNRQETVEWTVSDFDVLVPQKQTRSL
ncbi:unnamed protein product [Arabidopsis halleri]